MTYDLKELKSQVKKVLDYSDDADYKVDKLLDRWQKAKEKLFHDFGDRLIIESGSILTMDMPAEDKILMYHDYIDDIEYFTGDAELRDFLITQGWEAFYANSVVETWAKYGKVVPKGMKINRALKFFIGDVTALDKWQTRYSRLIQDLKVKGELCLSIHPLDYLSISETTHHWRSCHSLNGEYRAGNLSYMNDSVTVVAYLKSAKEQKLPNFPSTVLWNSKKWRMLLYINQNRDLIFSGKPYPFDNDILVKESYKMLEETTGKNWPSDYKEFEDNLDKCLVDYIDDHLDSLHFNDCLCSASYEPRYKCYYGNDEIGQCEGMVVGNKIYCLVCEEELMEFSADYSCFNCGDYKVCSCGNHMFSYESITLDDETLCPSCYDDFVVWCHTCGKPHNRENPSIVFNTEDEEWYCPKCYDALNNKE